MASRISKHLTFTSLLALQFILLSHAQLADAAQGNQQKVLLLVGDNYQTQDAWYVDRLERNDLAVTVVSAAAFEPQQARSYELIVISESVNSTDLANDVRDLDVPLVCLEPSLFDDLSMTGNTWQQDFGDAAGQSRLEIAAGSHPLNASLSGTVKVSSGAEKFVWGRPRPSAIKIARLVGSGAGDRWGIFAYEAGADLGGRPAAQRRVGFFAGRDSSLKLTQSGWTLFDASIRWAARRQVLMVVGQGPLLPSDAHVRGFIERRFGVEVVVKEGPVLRKSDFLGKRLGFISESVNSEDISDEMPGVGQPLVVLEPAIFDELGMTGPVWQKDLGDRGGQRLLSIINPAHPLAAGLSGTLNVINDDPSKFVWGVPSSSAIKVATVNGEPGALTIFAYEKGSQMVSGTSPARRVGWFAGRDTPVQLNAQGALLLQEAIAWAGTLPFAGSPCAALTDLSCKSPLVTATPINPVAVEPVPGYVLGPHYGCEPALAASAVASDEDGNQFFQELGYPTDPAVCRAPFAFCDNNDQPTAPPSVEQLNSTDPAFLVPCPPLKGAPTDNCGIDPRTLAQDCNAASDCTPGMVCATVCSDGACTSVTKRCGRPYASCDAIPAEDDLCDVREVRECPDPRAVGTVVPETLTQSLQVQTVDQPTIRVPEAEKPTVQPFEELTGAFCSKLPAEERAEARQDKASDSQEGNDQWGFFISPTAQQRFKISLKELADQTFEAGGSVGLKAGAVLMGAKITVVEALADVSLQHCGQQIGVTVKVFGDAIATCDTVQGGCQVGFQSIEPNSGGVGTAQAKKDECNTKFATRNAKAGDLRRALFMQGAVKDFYRKNGTTKDLCQRSNKQLGLHQDCNAPDLINNIDIPNAWDEEYKNTTREFLDHENDFNNSRDQIAGSGDVSLLDLRRRLTAKAATYSFAIGPVPVVLAFEVFGTWGLTGSIQYGISYGGGPLTLLANLTVPMATIMNDPADIRLLVGPVVTPHASLNVAAFAGVGFTALSLGIEGTLQLLSLSLPLDARLVASRVGEPDPRDLASSDWAGAPIEGMPTNKVWKWKYGWAYGAHLDITAMQGEIDAALRVRFLFVKKTFRKRITKWNGYSKTFTIAGAEGGEPLTGASDMGAFVDKVAYTHVDPLDGSDVIERPDPDAFYPDVLGREECGIIVQ